MYITECRNYLTIVFRTWRIVDIKDVDAKAIGQLDRFVMLKKPKNISNKAPV